LLRDLIPESQRKLKRVVTQDRREIRKQFSKYISRFYRVKSIFGKLIYGTIAENGSCQRFRNSRFHRAFACTLFVPYERIDILFTSYLMDLCKCKKMH